MSTNRGGQIAAYYRASVDQFLAASPDQVIGRLAAANPFPLTPEQRDAWQEEIQILTAALHGLTGTLYLEFDVPRLGSRIDAVLISGPAIFPIEFKCGERQYHLADRNQAWDYALDLKNFHRASHDAPIFPVLVATEAAKSDSHWKPPHPDDVREPRKCNPVDLGRVIQEGLALAQGMPLDGESWGSAPYHPTPTIIEAARALYSRHSVEAISRSEAEGMNLAITSVAVEEIIEQACAKREKAIVFVTGVPGAGKTLVGLNIATRHSTQGADRAVFLSGNGPLVDVLREALARDELSRSPKGTRKGQVKGKVKAFIQNVHHFRAEGIRSDDAPFDHVVIFDEAQRAWNLKKTADWLKRRKGIPDFKHSEPEFLISIYTAILTGQLSSASSVEDKRSTPERSGSPNGYMRFERASPTGTCTSRLTSRTTSTGRGMPWMDLPARTTSPVTPGCTWQRPCDRFDQRRSPHL